MSAQEIAIKPYLKSISIEKPSRGYSRYPFSVPALKNLNKLEFHADCTFLIGENGSGKSTILESIAVLMNIDAQGGTGNYSLETDSGLSGLHQFMHAKRSFKKPRERFFLRAESLFNVGTFLEKLADDPDACTSREAVFRNYGGKSPHERSHGESFLSLFVDTFKGHGLYLLDEPEAALSPERQLAAIVRMHNLIKQQSQFIIATHSPILMAYPNSKIYKFDDFGCNIIKYEDTQHYSITRDFLNNYPKRLEQLLEG